MEVRQPEIQKLGAERQKRGLSGYFNQHQAASAAAAERLLQQAEQEGVKPLLAVSQLGQLRHPDLKVEQDLCLRTLKKGREESWTGETSAVESTRQSIPAPFMLYLEN